MSKANDELIQKIAEYKKQIHQLEEKMPTANEEEKKTYNYQLTDLKAQLSLAQSELKNTWSEDHARSKNHQTEK